MNTVISVIVRSMDVPTLAAALESIFAQTWQHLQVLVVNAKGGVHSALPVAPRAGITLQLINQGGQPLQRSDAANAGLDAVCGNFFAFLDDDDTLDPTHFAELVQFQAGRDRIVYAGVRSCARNTPSEIIHVFHEEWEPGKLLAGNFLPIHAPLVPTSWLSCGVRFDPEVDIYEDWDFWLQLSRYTDFLRSPKITANYFVGGGSGANPHEVDAAFMQQATMKIYNKWMLVLGGQDLWDITRLYHVRNISLANMHGELQKINIELSLLDKDKEEYKLELNKAIHELESRKNELIEGRKKYINDIDNLNKELTQLKHSFSEERASYQRELNGIYKSKSWLITAPLRNINKWLGLNSLIKEKKHIFSFIYHVLRYSDGIIPLLRKILAIYRVEGCQGILRRLPLSRKPALDAALFIKEKYFSNTIIHGDGLKENPDGKIAVIVHAYYPDIFENFADVMQSIPWDFDLYVSVNHEDARVQILTIAKKIKKAKEVDVRITPNRGRDIAPFLVTFANEINNHDYVLHLHTKKSLYSGRERTEWRDYMLSGLLGSEQRVRHIFQQFHDEKNVGVIYPDTFVNLPYWAHTWLQNKGIALSLAARLGIDISHRNYVDAPMGSMFWARSKALKPLLDLKLNFEDFPEEKGQTDGTLQHTIERFIVLCAQQQGMTARALLDAPQGATLFFSPGRKNLQQYFAFGIKEKILGAAAAANIVSFDIFDTLLLRPWYSPENTFDYLEEKIEKNFSIKNFKKIRKQAEQLARQANPSQDVNIAQIYTVFGQLTGCGAEQAQTLMELECAQENADLFPNPEVCAAALTLAQQGKRLVLVSDMYLPPEFLRQLLAHHDLDFFSELYVSNDCHARKDNSSMWQLVLEREGVERQQWLHVGDNEHSDIQRPLDLGYLHPVHTMRAADQFMLFNEEASFWMTPQHWQEGLLLGLMANRIFVPGLANTPIALDCSQRRIEIADLHDFGYLVVGPALSVFMAWLLQRADADGIQKLLYASREGHLLIQAHETIAQYRASLGKSTVQGSYFLCSRVAAGLAAASQPEGVRNLLQAHFSGSFADLLRQRYGVEDLEPFAQRLGQAAMDRHSNLPEGMDRFLDLLHQSFDLLQPQASEACQRYRDYAHGLIGKQRCALVDIGYGASIQKSLAECLDGIAGGYYFVTTDKALSVEEKGQFAQGCFGHGINPFHSDIPLYQYSLLFEAVLTAPHGQLLGFDVQGQARYKAPGLAQKNFADLERIHAGALAFLRDVLATTGEDFFAMGHCHQASQLPIRQTMQGRWTLGFSSPALHVEDNFSGNEEISVFEFYERKRHRLPGVLS